MGILPPDVKLFFFREKLHLRFLGDGTSEFFFEVYFHALLFVRVKGFDCRLLIFNNNQLVIGWLKWFAELLFCNNFKLGGSEVVFFVFFHYF